MLLALVVTGSEREKEYRYERKRVGDPVKS
jgi:hypothetical protein